MIKLILLVFFTSFAYAKTYTLYLASTKYLDVAKNYYDDIRFRTPDFYDVVIRNHVKKNYSVIIRNIPNIEKAKKIQTLFFVQNRYKDSYIKMYITNPSYTIVKIDENRTAQKEEKLYKQNIEETNEYILASTMYNTGQYKKAYDLFFKLFLKDNYNLNVNYFLAKSAFNIKRYDEATAAFERVLIQKPDFNQARYDFAKVLYVLKINEEAKKEFNKLLEKEIKEETKNEIKEYLAILDKRNKKLNGSASIMLGLSRSSNVNNGLVSPEYRLPGLNDIIVSGEEPIADTAHFQAVNLNFYNYFKSYPLRVKNSFLVYNKSYLNEKDENITVFSYKPAISYINKEHLYTLELSADRIRKRTNEDFYAFSLSPKFANKHLETYLKYQRVIYLHEEQKEKEFDKIQFFAMFNLFENFNFYTNIYQNRRKEDIRTDIDKYTIGNGFNLFYNINSKNQINLNYQLDYSKYKYENIGFGTKREDKEHLVELTFKHKIDDTNLINLSTSYTKNHSNQEAYDYDENTIKLNYIKGFKW